MYNNDQAHADFEREREADKTDVEDEIMEDNTTLEEKLEALKKLNN